MSVWFIPGKKIGDPEGAAPLVIGQAKRALPDHTPKAMITDIAIRENCFC
jgi:hypothetical protein